MVSSAQTGFGKTEKQTFTDEEQAAKREEKFDALTKQRDKVGEQFFVFVFVGLLHLMRTAAPMYSCCMLPSSRR